jgi:hypothetical protein
MSANSKTPVSPTLNIPQGLDTVYCNLARISHSPADIVIDFAHLLPADTTAAVKARVLMSPRALTENLARYEAAFGQINVPVNTSLAEHLFRPNQTPEDPKS